MAELISFTTPKPLRVCLDARLVSKLAGGVQQVIIGLAKAFSGLADGSEQYFFLTYSDEEEWLKPFIGEGCHILRGARFPAKGKAKLWLSSTVPLFRDAWHKFTAATNSFQRPLPISDGTIERAGIEIMHFTTPSAFCTDVTSIYEPYDLQHLFFPDYFTPRERENRERTYRAFCTKAKLVIAMTMKGKEDLISIYGLPEQKVGVVPLAPVLGAYPAPDEEAITQTKSRLHLPSAFIFYPAQTWPHKNHIRLLDALARLRSEDHMVVPLVCSGHRNGFFNAIEKHAKKLGITDQVHFLGFVSPMEIQCLYRLSRCLIFPTEFEGFGMPLLEAFWAGVPVACSRISPLVEQARDGALLFDPGNPEEISRCIWMLWTNDDLCRVLASKGKEIAKEFSWGRTARLFRAHYRRMAKRELTKDDRALLAAPPPV